MDGFGCILESAVISLLALVLLDLIIAFLHLIIGLFPVVPTMVALRALRFCHRTLSI